jgi:hypothetical protein
MRQTMLHTRIFSILRILLSGSLFALPLFPLPLSLVMAEESSSDRLRYVRQPENSTPQMNSVMEEPLALARLHCRQWLAFLDYGNQPAEAVLNAISYGIALENAPETALRFDAAKSLGIAPDMGFLLEERWQRATRAERQLLNQQIAIYLGKHYRLRSSESIAASCTAEIQLQILESAPDPSGKFTLPALPSWLARVKVLMPVTTNQMYQEVNYLLLREGENFWQIRDIRFGKESMTAKYGTDWQKQVAEGGFKGLSKWLNRQPATSQ